MNDPEVIVIGAGPGGLAMGAQLKKAGINFTILEKENESAHSWKNHYHRLSLHTAKSESYLPGKPFNKGLPEFVPRLDFVRYLEEYALENDIKPLFGVEVYSIEKDNEAYLVKTNKSDFTSQFVVLATGFCNIEKDWQVPGLKDSNLKLIPASAYRNILDPIDLRDQKVLIVGMGNTGAEIALDLAENSVEVSLSVRSEVVRIHRELFGRPTQLSSIALSKLPDFIAFPVSRLVQKLTVSDLGRYGLRSRKISPLKQLYKEGKTPVIDLGTGEMIKAGKIRVFPGVKYIDDRDVQFVDGESALFDVVITAIGYSNGLAGIVKSWSRNMENDQPNIKWRYLEVPGLYFIGFDARMNGQLRGIRLQSEMIVNEIIALKSTENPIA